MSLHKPDQMLDPERNNRWTIFLQYGAFAFMLFGIKLWLIGSYGNATPFWDQWDGEGANLYNPFLENKLGLTDLVAPHNEHRILNTRLFSLGVLMINKLWNPLLQMILNAALHVMTIVFGISLLTRVLGRSHLPALLIFSLVLFGLPFAWENTLAAFQSQFYFVLLFSVSCLWLTVTKSPLSRGWWSGIICGIFAFFSLASGIFAFAAAAIISLLFYFSGLRKSIKQLIAVGILSGLFLAGTLLTPTLAHHASLKAASVGQFYKASIAVFGWPISSGFISAVIRNSPALIFIIGMIWKRPSVNDRRWFLVALVVWSFGQAVSIAYGRAVGNLSSRYLDLFAVNILVNFACLISVAQNYMDQGYKRVIAGASAWIAVVIISLGLYGNRYLPAELSAKRDMSLAQEINTRNYLATGDLKVLKEKAYLQIPYPDADRLAMILSWPKIREILPTNIGLPLTPTSVESSPINAFVINGYYPTTPKRADSTWGSYNLQGDAGTGQLFLRFDNNKKEGRIEIPVAGYPLNSEVKIVIEQNGKQRPVSIKENPKEAWVVAFSNIQSGPFSMHLIDSSATTWLVAGAPSVSGRLDRITGSLLSRYYVFIFIGLGVLVFLLTQYGLIQNRKKALY